jgi:spermidine synthase
MMNELSGNGRPVGRQRVVESLDGKIGEIVLFSRETPSGPRYEITIGGHFVMAASDGPTEKRLADSALSLIDSPGGIEVLIGGLGLGQTLARTLDDSRVARVDVAELESAVIGWNRTVLRGVNNGALFDRRTKVVCADVTALIEKKACAFDAVLLDVDNGPSFLIFEHNAFLYTERGLRKVRRCLKDGGVLAVWSNRPDEALAKTLTEVFGNAAVEFIDDPNLREDLPPTAIYTSIK